MSDAPPPPPPTTPDVVGIGALNLDYLVDVGRRGAGAALPVMTRLQRLLSAAHPDFEWGTELSVDAATVQAALDEIDRDDVEVVLGGSAFNAIRALARMDLGIPLGYVGVAGHTHVRSWSVREEFNKWDIDDSLVHHDPERLCGACVSILHEGERTLCTHAGANAAMATYLRDEHERLVSALAKARFLHVTSLLDPDGPGELHRLLRAVRDRNPEVVISVDPGHVWATRPTTAVEGIIGLADYLLVNEREFRSLGHGDRRDSSEEVAQRVVERFGRRRGVVIVKRSTDIANFHYEEGKVRATRVMPPTEHGELSAVEIEDSTGAGDVFAAGVLAALASERLHIELGSMLGMALARHKLRHMGTDGHDGFADITRQLLRSLDTGPRAPRGADCIFISHGRSPQWRALQEFLDRRCSFPNVRFSSGAWSGKPVTDALERFLEQCSVAICVLTADDTAGDRLWARENVVHEVGLFQGRLGEDRVILLVEEGCEFVPEAPRRQVITFPPGRIEGTFWQVHRRLDWLMPGAAGVRRSRR
ncbi:MAG TPA: PfkB family carbohydrate kinase [Acidimicrobiales bacterium]